MITKYKASLNGVAGMYSYNFNTLEELRANIDNFKSVYKAQGGFDAKKTELCIFHASDSECIMKKEDHQSYAYLCKKFQAHLDLVEAYVAATADAVVDHRGHVFVNMKELNDFKAQQRFDKARSRAA